MTIEIIFRNKRFIIMCVLKCKTGMALCSKVRTRYGALIVWKRLEKPYNGVI